MVLKDKQIPHEETNQRIPNAIYSENMINFIAYEEGYN